MPGIEFGSAFEQLTGNKPFPWLTTLYEDWFAKGVFPSTCNIPTGLGKTSVVAVWLIALAKHPDKMPRRLVYVVNRRTVVDQTTDEVEKYRVKLESAGLNEALAGMCAIKLKDEEPPLALSTLRGQFADNREWSADPARPAVIVGTVDMIGSRLLFSGYRIGFKGKPLHAGFLGQDVLLVHDEAHLEPAFQDLLVAICKEQDRCKEFRFFRVMALTATSRNQDAKANGNLELTAEDKADAAVKKRIRATKRITLHQNTDEKKLADAVVEFALKFKDSKRAILIFVRKVEDVEKVVKKLPKNSSEQLTGTLRGKERDELIEKPIFRRFLPGAEASDETVYLVCTSAGEVGVNISADHLVCDLTTFESMAQRFGRVNRFGERGDTEIHIIYPKEFDNDDQYEQRRKNTLELLKKLNGDGSPAALGNLDTQERQEAFAPLPTILPVTDILFDSWALTTIREKLPGRAPVEPYLHGIAERDPPQTYVAWREEVWELDPRGKLKSGPLFQDAGQRRAFEERAAELLEDYPLKPHELLRDSTFRKNSGVQATLARLAGGQEHLPAWIQDLDGTLAVLTLGDLSQADLVNATVILPPQAGGLTNGLLTPDQYDPSRTDYDVADEWRDEKGRQRRLRVWDNDPVPTNMRLIRTIDTNPDADETAEEEATGRRFWRWYELPNAGDTEGSKSSKKPVLWQVHTDDVVTNTTDLVAKLPLPEDMKRAVIVAAKFHDLGKWRPLFQRILGNSDPQLVLAKSGKRAGRVPELYRHEFGSLLDVEGKEEFQRLSDEMKELVRHLIAVHHGRGRPHFPEDEAFDPEPKGRDVAAIAADVPRRFARLQRKYGRWGLAYLESLLRAADYAASANPSAFVEDGR